MTHPLKELPYIFTTLRFDASLSHHAANTAASDGLQSPVYLLKYHCDRLRDAAAALGDRYDALDLDDVLGSPGSLEKMIMEAIEKKTSQEEPAGPFRVRLALKFDGSVDIQCPQVPQTHPVLYPKSLDDSLSPTWTVCLDTQSTQRNLHTSFKTSERHAYDRARQIAGCTLAGSKEALLYNTDGQIMDASITTPYFHRDGRWVTPPASAGGQQGTTRRWALENHLCIEENIGMNTLHEGEVIWLSNAARGFFAAKFTST